MERYSIENFIVDENELAEHYKDKGNKRGYKGKLKLVEYLKELKAYKEAEEQGLLLRLPVVIGRIVYRINEYADEPLIPMVVTSIEIKGITNTFKEMKCKECGFGGEFTYSFSDIGKTVFLTKEATEQALAEMKGV